MKSKAASVARNTVILASVAGLLGLARAMAAQPVLPKHLSGLINDYSPAHINGTSVKGGPYEMRGSWSMELHRGSQTATFSAALNMETTDAGATVSQDDPSTRSAHTHHITMMGPLDYDTSSCPASDPSSPVAWRFLINGPAQITGNGNVAPFQAKLGVSTLQVCIGGGKDGTLEFSNVTLALGAPANTHFGPQPIHGVVTACRWGDEPESSDCTATW